MVIDIVAFTNKQMNALSEKQLRKIKSVQLKKNRLKRALDKNMTAERNRLINGGLFHSDLYELLKADLQKAYDDEIEVMKEELLVSLTDLALEDGVPRAPYTLDFDLSYEERFDIVKDYYMGEYSDDVHRFMKFKEDEVAIIYLGEYYKPLYDYLLGLAY